MPDLMPDARWHVPALIRISVVLHVLALAGLAITPAHWRWALGTVVANHLLITAVGLWPRSQWLGPNWTRLPAAATARNEIALTIDDGPDPIVTPHVLDLLEQYDVCATFFCIADQAAQHPQLPTALDSGGLALRGHCLGALPSASAASSSDCRSLTEKTRTDLSILFSKPPRTLPGPTSTKIVTPCPTSSRAACVNLTGAVS